MFLIPNDLAASMDFFNIFDWPKKIILIVFFIKLINFFYYFSNVPYILIWA